MANYQVGNIVTYVDFCGGSRSVVVTARDIIKGRPGFDGYIYGDEPLRVWGYDHQIVSVLPLVVSEQERADMLARLNGLQRS